jgi:hypothetical protein
MWFSIHAGQRQGASEFTQHAQNVTRLDLCDTHTGFADDVLRFYPRLRRDEIRFLLFEAGAHVTWQLALRSRA